MSYSTRGPDWYTEELESDLAAAKRDAEEAYVALGRRIIEAEDLRHQLAAAKRELAEARKLLRNTIWSEPLAGRIAAFLARTKEKP